MTLKANVSLLGAEGIGTACACRASTGSEGLNSLGQRLNANAWSPYFVIGATRGRQTGRETEAKMTDHECFSPILRLIGPIPSTSYVRDRPLADQLGRVPRSC